MPVFITAIGTAVPQNCFPQTQIAEFMASALQLDEYEKRKLFALYRSTKISQRYSVLSDYGQKPENFTFFPKNQTLEPFPTISARMDAYRLFALPLVLDAVNNLGSSADLTQITHIITVSCTGMYAPGLDIELIQELHLKTNIQRTAINFMGCYGAFNGLKVADAICNAQSNAKVLVICVELCTIHFQKKTDEDFLLSNALFSDGAAAVIIESSPIKNYSKTLELKSFYCDLVFEGKQDMAWQVADFGFEMTLTSYIPRLVKKGIKDLIDSLLEKNHLSKESISLYAMHPGGKAILESIESAIGISKDDNRFAYHVLNQYGNMSSCTVLFVLKQLLEETSADDHGKNILSCAFGPGLTLESMILNLHCSA